MTHALSSSVAHLEPVVRERLIDGDHPGLPLRERVRRICAEEVALAPSVLVEVAGRVSAALTGMGPIEPLLADPDVSEVMVNGPDTVFVERAGRIEPTDVRFSDADSVLAMIERVVGPLGLRIDRSMPTVDARLPDGSRFHAIIPPLAPNGPVCNIRRFVLRESEPASLAAAGFARIETLAYLCDAVRDRRTVLVTGGTSSGKTTFLNVLSQAIPSEERVITIEDAAELRLAQPHVVTLEARPANSEGRGAVSVRDLVRAALRMRPDRIIVGEVRGGEAVDMLAAMNTGHEGSLGTLHANSPEDAISRLETVILMTEPSWPLEALRRQIVAALDLVVHLARRPDGRRVLDSVSRVSGRDGDLVLECVRLPPSPEGAR